MANRPDVIIRNGTGKICLLKDVAIPSGRSVTKREAGKELKSFSIQVCDYRYLSSKSLRKIT
jgi:hypothetical protein